MGDAKINLKNSPVFSELTPMGIKGDRYKELNWLFESCANYCLIL
jgi:hypothetical protein